MKSLLLAGTAAALAVCAQGCATFNQGRALAISVIDLVPTQTALLETSAEMRLRLTNEGAEPLPLAGSSHRLYLNGTYVGRAVTAEGLTVPALGTATQRVIVHLENLTLLRKVAELSQAAAPVLGYRLESRLHGTGALEGRIFRTANSGEVDLSRLVSLGTKPNVAPTAQK
jgi:LEA14-like dessication related protein